MFNYVPSFINMYTLDCLRSNLLNPNPSGCPPGSEDGDIRRRFNRLGHMRVRASLWRGWREGGEGGNSRSLPPPSGGGGNQVSQTGGGSLLSINAFLRSLTPKRRPRRVRSGRLCSDPRFSGGEWRHSASEGPQRDGENDGFQVPPTARLPAAPPPSVLLPVSGRWGRVSSRSCVRPVLVFTTPRRGWKGATERNEYLISSGWGFVRKSASFSLLLGGC